MASKIWPTYLWAVHVFIPKPYHFFHEIVEVGLRLKDSGMLIAISDTFCCVYPAPWSRKWSLVLGFLGGNVCVVFANVACGVRTYNICFVHTHLHSHTHITRDAWWRAFHHSYLAVYRTFSWSRSDRMFYGPTTERQTHTVNLCKLTLLFLLVMQILGTATYLMKSEVHCFMIHSLNIIVSACWLLFLY